MKRNEDSYEVVARFLDGEAIELSDAQRALAAEIAADGERIGVALDVEVPPGVLHRVAARLPGAARARRRRLAIGTGLGAAAAVAAGVILTIALGRPERPSAMPIAPETYVAQVIKTPVDGDLTALAGEIAAVEQDLASSDPWTTENWMVYLETQIRDMEADVPTSVWPAEWNELEDAL